MRTEIDRKRTMASSATILDQTRRRAAFLVDRRARDTGSRMAAYETVASAIGSTSGWLRKFIGRCPDVNPDFVTGFNICRLYVQWCSRVEENIAVERALIAQLREQMDAADFSAVDLGEAATQERLDATEAKIAKR